MRPIDADEVTRDLASFKYSKEYGEVEEVYNRAVSDCIVDIEATPTLKNMKPVVHAHWDADEGGFYSCSNCGYEWDESEYYTHYCPDCGAKMDEEKQDE